MVIECDVVIFVEFTVKNVAQVLTGLSRHLCKYHLHGAAGIAVRNTDAEYSSICVLRDLQHTWAEKFLN